MISVNQDSHFLPTTVAGDMSKLDLKINKHELDDEWERQPELFMEWGEKMATAQAEVDNLSSRLDLVKAQLEIEIRQNPEAYGLEKTTEKVIAAALVQQPDYRACEKRLNEARKELHYAKAAVTGLEHRKRALTMLVELFVRDYYSDSHKPRIQERAMQEDKRRDVRRRGRDRRRRNSEDDE